MSQGNENGCDNREGTALPFHSLFTFMYAWQASVSAQVVKISIANAESDMKVENREWFDYITA